MDKGCSDALALDELLLFLEQFSDAPLTADGALGLSAPPVAPPVAHVSAALPYQELHPKAQARLIHGEEVEWRCFDEVAFGEDSVSAEPMSACEEPIFTTEEREMLLVVLQGPTFGPEDQEAGNGHACSEQAQSAADGSSYCSSSSGSGSESVASGGLVAAGHPQQGTLENDTSDKSVDSSRVATDSIVKAQQAPRRKQARRPNRRRRKHEVDELREQMQKLSKELIRLRVQGQSLAALSLIQKQQQQGGVGNLAIKSSAEPSAWRLAAASEREKTHAAKLENARLRAQYESQLDVLQRLQAMCWNQFDFTAMTGFSLPGTSLTKRPKHDPFDDDFAIFASLGRDFDAQYEDIDRILEAAGLLHFDGELAAELRVKTDSRGKFFMESMHSRVIPRDMFIMDRAIGETNKSAKLHQLHKFHEVRHATDTISFTKFVDVIRLPHAEATLTVRMAIKRFVFPDRVAGVWESVIDVSGCVSMRLHEKGWNALRPPRVMPVNHSGGPLSIEQSCVRYFPIENSVSSDQDLAAGTINRILVDSYRRHLHRMHEITDDILSNDFDKLLLA